MNRKHSPMCLPDLPDPWVTVTLKLREPIADMVNFVEVRYPRGSVIWPAAKCSLTWHGSVIRPAAAVLAGVMALSGCAGLPTFQPPNHVQSS